MENRIKKYDLLGGEMMKLECSVEELKLLFKNFKLKEETSEMKTYEIPLNKMLQRKFPNPSIQLIRDIYREVPQEVPKED